MPMSDALALQTARNMMAMRDRERSRLDVIRTYLRDDPNERILQGLPPGVPSDVVRLTRLSRVNLLKYVVNARVQNLYVDGMQTPTEPGNVAAWSIWQGNRLDSRQIGVHRAALAYGAAYTVVMPGTTMPVIRGASPRDLTAAYGDDDDWPRYAWQRQTGDRWRLIDDEAVYPFRSGDTGLEAAGSPQAHGATYDGAPVCPVVRYRDTDDLDDPVRGIVEPYMPLQDQINITTFGLGVAQHYGAFRQRYVIGWLAENEQKALETSAGRLMMFEEPDVKVSEFAQTDLRGYLESREANIRHLATVSQTPVHELMGQFINLSAEALEAARASHQAAVDENRVMCGESWEQALNLAGEMAGERPDPTANIMWRDTRVRSLEQAAAALRQLVEGLGVPPRALWPRIPGVAQHELARWETLAEQGDTLGELEQLLDRQAAG